MRIFWVSLLLAGLCLAKEEEVTDDLQEIEGRRLQQRSDTPCSGCGGSKGVDKTTSSVVTIPALPGLPNLLNKKPIDQVINSANNLVGSVSATGADATDDLLLKIGNIVSYFSNPGTNPITIDDDKFNGIFSTGTMMDNNALEAGSLAAMFGLAGLPDAAGGKFGSLVSLLNLFKSGVLELGARGLEIANFILAIIGLALIVAYVVENDGELGVLGLGFTGTGTGTAGGAFTAARSFMSNPVVDGLTNLVYDAISKYE